MVVHVDDMLMLETRDLYSLVEDLLTSGGENTEMKFLHPSFEFFHIQVEFRVLQCWHETCPWKRSWFQKLLHAGVSNDQT